MRRAGFSMVELVVSLLIVSAVTVAATTTLVRQQRFYTRAGAVLEVKSQLRGAAGVLASDIRGAAVAPLGVPLMSDSAIELFTTIGSSIVCTLAGPQTFGLPPSVLANGNTLTSLSVSPDTGDLVEVRAAASANPDSAGWMIVRVASFASRSIASTCPPASSFTTASDAVPGAMGYQLVVAGSPASVVTPGAPVRFLRRARYSLYKSSDNLWYLGYRRCAAVSPNACAAIQPVSGPYRGYGGPGASGLSFRYYNAAGAEIAPASSGADLARVEIVVRGQSSDYVGLSGDIQKIFRDSVVVTVSPRNRFR